MNLSRNWVLGSAWAGAAVLAASVATAAPITVDIDFSSLPDGSPLSEGLQIGQQYVATDGISFSQKDGGAPILVEKDQSLVAFWGYEHRANVLRPSQRTGIGDYYLVGDRTGMEPPSPLIITYPSQNDVSEDVTSAGGQIFDIDRHEAWKIQALDSNGNVLSTIKLKAGDPGTGSGKVTPWSFTNVTGLASVKIKYIGTSATVGYAMDNFTATMVSVGQSPTPAPEPGTIFSSLGLAAFGLMRRRRVTAR